MKRIIIRVYCYICGCITEHTLSETTGNWEHYKCSCGNIQSYKVR